MGWTDALLAGAIVIGAIYLLYRSLWKKQGYCPGCDSHTCGVGRKDEQLAWSREEKGQAD
ncbi:MAG: hypothetical protein ACOZFS_07220 [Thermodesulfobacteriota bacterium]